MRHRNAVLALLVACASTIATSAPVPAEVEARKQISKLSSDVAGDRLAAAVELGRLGHRISVAPLLAVLADDTDISVRRVAARALGQIGDGRAIPGLIDALADREILVATEASRALRSLTGVSHGFAPELTAEQRAAVQEKWRAWWKQRRTAKKPADPVALVEMLASDSANERFRAAVELGHRRYVRAVTPLAERLATDRDYFVRRACARALGEIRRRQAVPALIAALTDKEIFVALQAARSLKAITGRKPGLLTERAGPEERLKIQKRFRAWWEKKEKDEAEPEDGATDR